jgi:hypothetical protein
MTSAHIRLREHPGSEFRISDYAWRVAAGAGFVAASVLPGFGNDSTKVSILRFH